MTKIHLRHFIENYGLWYQMPLILFAQEQPVAVQHYACSIKNIRYILSGYILVCPTKDNFVKIYIYL